MKRLLLVAASALLVSATAQAQVINTPNSETCTRNFDSSYVLQLAARGFYTSQILSSYHTAFSAGGSGRGGGYKPGHTTVTYSQITSVTVSDSAGRLLATFTNTPTSYNGHQLDNQAGSFISTTRSVTIEVIGICKSWHGLPRTTPILALGTANFTLSVNGPPLPPPARQRDD